MTVRRALSRLLPLGASFLLLALLTIMSAPAQGLPCEIRIGLQTGQQLVRLQGVVPVRVEAGGKALYAADPGQVLAIQPGDGGCVVLDEDGNALLTGQGRLQFKPAPAGPDTRAPDPDNPPPPPLLRLLGPTRHYDGRPDRPYRGYLEVLPRPDGLTVVNVVDLEQYLWGVVSSEMHPSYPGEALKAQAIAARTFALKNLGRCDALGFDLDDTAACQVYGGYLSEDPRSTRAVNDTAGVVLLYRGKLIDAVYASTCGGYTESAEAAWGRPVPYLVSVPDYLRPRPPIAPRPRTEEAWAAYCKTARAVNCLQPEYAKPEAFRWIKLMTRREIEAGLPAAYQVGALRNIVPVRRGLSGRIYALRVEGDERAAVIEGELNIRRAFGGLRSSAFTVDVYRDDDGVPVVFAFWGAGWGHGLGMCQVGAVGLALKGWTYDKILTYYYHGVTIEPR